MSSLQEGIYSRNFKYFISDTSGHVEKELEAKCNNTPVQLFCGLPCYSRLDKGGEN
jgi:hypothetical protein